MEKEILATIMAVSSDIDDLTNDRLEALTKGHGMLNLAVLAVANTIVEEVSQGAKLELRFENQPHISLEDTLEKCIRVAIEAGADGANAALISATMLYLAGTNPRAGVPAGNRKLGAMARMVAKVDRCGVAAIPTPKMNNKVSAYPAVAAIYQAIREGQLCPIDGRLLPEGVGGGPIYGHSALGEDIVFPTMAREGARIGTQAMLEAMAGAGMPINPMIAAILGTASIMEIVHPDSAVSPEYGPYHQVTSSYLAGESAASTAGLPPKTYLKGTGEEYQTAKVVGDLGLILKDIGGPSVVGMMAFKEMISVLVESPYFPQEEEASTVQSPLGHPCSDGVIAMKLLIKPKQSIAGAADTIQHIKDYFWIDPEIGKIALNTVARKAEQIKRGPVTKALILASEGARAAGFYARSLEAYQQLVSGKNLKEVVQGLEKKRQQRVEERCALYFTRKLGKKVAIKFTKICSGARRPEKFIKKHLSFDMDADAVVTIDGQEILLEGIAHRVVPRAVMEKDERALALLPIATVPLTELSLSAHTIINITIPAAISVALGQYSPEEAASIAEEAAYISAGIPGAKERAVRVATLAQRILREMN